MIKRLSEHLNIEPSKLQKYGVFDALIGVDSLLFVDPLLLHKTTIPDFKNSASRLKTYYEEIVTLLSSSEKTYDRAWQEAKKRLIFREMPGVSIGYGKSNRPGSGVGSKLATQLLESAQQIIRMGFKDPKIFELLGLFEEDFGADRLSDMTLRVICEDVLIFTERVCKELSIADTVIFNFSNKEYLLPKSSNGKHILFLPREILSDLPVATSWEDIGRVVRFNNALRSRVNKIISRVWRDKRPSKSEFKDFILTHPDDIEILLKEYKNSAPDPYDFDIDPNGFVRWLDLGKQFVKSNALKLQIPESPNVQDLKNTVKEIIVQFKKLVEQNGLKLHLYYKDAQNGSYYPLHESYAQKLFYAVADSYCKANNIDLSAEPNAGNGPVDFKFSKGYELRVLVEVKLTSNSNLVKGVSRQLGAYQEAEDTKHAIYLVIKVTKSDSGIKRLESYHEELKKESSDVPDIYYIDATITPSASKR